MFSKWLYLALMIWCIVYGLVAKNLNETMSIIISIWFIGSAICLEIKELGNKGDKNKGDKKMTREELRNYVDEQRTLNNIPYHVYSALIDGIDTLEQEPRIGYWVKKSQYENDYCSECDCELLLAYKPKHCPNCGAKMRKVR